MIAHARWQLYLDGQPHTFDEIAAIADASPDRLAVMHRICGRHEWDDSHDPFYETAEPGMLHTPKES